jgi:SAM-dependent MidA family methyltransferase
MQLCLSHPTEGYYMNPENEVIGARGDFITSPEISQVFGEVRVSLGRYWETKGNELSRGRVAGGYMAFVTILELWCKT